MVTLEIVYEAKVTLRNHVVSRFLNSVLIERIGKVFQKNYAIL